MTQLNFPVATRQLSDWLPHRGAAVWVDEVTWVKADEGECRIHLRQSANYADGQGHIRDSSFVEWMAQAYGFVCACQALTEIMNMSEKPKKAFLVQISDFEMSQEPAANRIVEGDWISVRVKRSHQVGPIALVDGVVLSSKELVLARAKIKLFAE